MTDAEVETLKHESWAAWQATGKKRAQDMYRLCVECETRREEIKSLQRALDETCMGDSF